MGEGRGREVFLFVCLFVCFFVSEMRKREGLVEEEREGFFLVCVHYVCGGWGGQREERNYSVPICTHFIILFLFFFSVSFTYFLFRDTKKIK